jgi:hypothetical protein
MSHLGQKCFLEISNRAAKLRTRQFGEVVDTKRWPKPLVTQSFEHLP